MNVYAVLIGTPQETVTYSDVENFVESLSGWTFTYIDDSGERVAMVIPRSNVVRVLTDGGDKSEK